MSSLYGKRKAKAFDHNDDEFSSSVGSIFAKKTASKRPIKEVNDDDDDENDDIITKSKKSKLEEVGGQEDDPDYRAQIRAKLQTVKPKNVSLPKSVPISQTSLSTRGSRKSLDVDLTSPTKDEGFKEAASLLLKKMTLSKKSLSQSSSNSSSSKLTEIIELDSPSNFVVPKVPQAAKRVLVPSTSNGSSAVMSIDRMQALAGRTASISSSSLSGAFGATGICEKPHRKIKTRLNGTHERKWKVGLDEPFGRVKANFAVAYGVKAAEVRFEFDGSVVRDSDTAEGLDMEDEDILEAKINKALYEKAVKYSDAQLNAQTSTSTTPAVVSSSSSRNGTTSSTSAPSANNNNTNANSNKPSIKLCTRLNGKHEWKWKVPIDEGFDKIRSNLALFYGLNSATAITLVFDGNKLQDSDTPQALEMENDDMIDAKIDASLYDGAIATATARKSSI